MGWKDAPIVGGSPSPKWSSAPVVDDGADLRSLPPPTPIDISPNMGKAMREEMAGRSWLENNLAAAGNALRGPYEGVKQLLGVGDKQNAEAVRTIDQEAPVGSIAGNVALFALPGMQTGGVIRSGVVGGVAGGLQPTVGNETHVGNAAIGAGIGGGGAAVFKAFPYVSDFLKSTTGKYVGGLVNSPRMMAPALRNAVAQDVAAITTSADQAALAGFKQHPFMSHTPTVADITQSPKIASAEKASRTQMRDFWQAVDEEAAGSRWNALDQVLGTKSSQEAAEKVRDTATSKIRDAALKGSLPQPVQAQFARDVGRAVKSDAAANPAVLTIANYLQSDINRVGGNITPNQLYQMRQTLTGWVGGKPPPGQPQIKADRSDPFIMSIVNKIDDILNTHSKGKFGDYLAKFAQESGPVDSQKAGRAIRNQFVDEELNVPRFGPANANFDPMVTPAQLRGAYLKYGANSRFGKETLDYGTDDVVRAVLNDLERSNIHRRVNLAQTGGGGSNTAGDIARAAGGVAGGWKGSLAAKFLNDRVGGNFQNYKNQVMALALSDPEGFQRVLAYPGLLDEAAKRLSNRGSRFVALPMSQWIVEQ